jgi:hypothetical protein
MPLIGRLPLAQRQMKIDSPLSSKFRWNLNVFEYIFRLYILKVTILKIKTQAKII